MLRRWRRIQLTVHKLHRLTLTARRLVNHVQNGVSNGRLGLVEARRRGTCLQNEVLHQEDYSEGKVFKMLQAPLSRRKAHPSKDYARSTINASLQESRNLHSSRLLCWLHYSLYLHGRNRKLRDSQRSHQRASGWPFWCIWAKFTKSCGKNWFYIGGNAQRGLYSWRFDHFKRLDKVRVWKYHSDWLRTELYIITDRRQRRWSLRFGEGFPQHSSKHWAAVQDCFGKLQGESKQGWRDNKETGWSEVAWTKEDNGGVNYASTVSGLLPKFGKNTKLWSKYISLLYGSFCWNWKWHHYENCRILSVTLSPPEVTKWIINAITCQCQRHKSCLLWLKFISLVFPFFTFI